MEKLENIPIDVCTFFSKETWEEPNIFLIYLDQTRFNGGGGFDDLDEES